MTNYINAEKMIPKRNQTTLLLVGATLIIWGLMLIGFILLYKGVF